MLIDNKKIYVVIKQKVVDGGDIVTLEMMSDDLNDCVKYLDDLMEKDNGEHMYSRTGKVVDAYDILTFYLYYKETTTYKFSHKEIYKIL